MQWIQDLNKLLETHLLGYLHPLRFLFGNTRASKNTVLNGVVGHCGAASTSDLCACTAVPIDVERGQHPGYRGEAVFLASDGYKQLL